MAPARLRLFLLLRRCHRNSRGGVESDLTIVPLATDEFYVVTSSATCTRDADHILTAARDRGLLGGGGGSGCDTAAAQQLSVDEITDDWAVLALMGPESRAIASAVFPDADLRDIKRRPQHQQSRV